MGDVHSAVLVAVIAVVTAALRMAPFLVFGGRRETPAYIIYLGKVLPFALIGMLVVFCFKNVSFAAAPFGLPELIAGLLTAGLHIWRRNTLLSVGCGTVCYMLLVQLVF